MRLAYLFTIPLLAAGSPALAAKALSCQTLYDSYTELSQTLPSAPDLFATPFKFASLQRAKLNGTEIPNRMEQVELSVKNHIGYLECAHTGELMVADICMQTLELPGDNFLETRFSTVSATLYAAASGRDISESASVVADLVSLAMLSLKDELVKGSEYPQGVASTTFGSHLSAQISTTPAIGTGDLREICFQIGSDLAFD